MDKQEIEQLIKAGIHDYMTDKQFNLSKIPSHTHDGKDTNKILQKNVIPNQKVMTFMIEDTSETFTISNIPNITRISFLGFAANNKSAPATKRAIINGIAEFGNCFGFSGSGTNISFASNVSLTPEPIQAYNYMYTDTSNLTKTRVGAGNGSYSGGVYTSMLCRAADDTGGDVVALEITSYTSSSITFTCTLTADWKLQGTLILT